MVLKQYIKDKTKIKIGIIDVSSRTSRGEDQDLLGKPKSIKECLEVVFPAIPYCIDLIEGLFIETNPEEMKVFRPKNR